MRPPLAGGAGVNTGVPLLQAVEELRVILGSRQ